MRLVHPSVVFAATAVLARSRFLSKRALLARSQSLRGGVQQTIFLKFRPKSARHDEARKSKTAQHVTTSLDNSCASTLGFVGGNSWFALFFSHNSTGVE